MKSSEGTKGAENTINFVKESSVLITLHCLSLVILFIYYKNNLFGMELTLHMLMEPVNIGYGWHNYCYPTPASLAEP